MNPSLKGRRQGDFTDLMVLKQIDFYNGIDLETLMMSTHVDKYSNFFQSIIFDWLLKIFIQIFSWSLYTFLGGWQCVKYENNLKQIVGQENNAMQCSRCMWSLWEPMLYHRDWNGWAERTHDMFPVRTYRKGLWKHLAVCVSRSVL